MSLIKWLRRRLRRKQPKDFTLEKRGKPGIPGAREDVISGKHQERPAYATEEAKAYTRKLEAKGSKPEISAAHKEDMAPPQRSRYGGMSAEKQAVLGSTLGKDIEHNLQTLMHIFHAPRNSDLIVRRLEIKCSDGAFEAAIVYFQELVDSKAIEESILRPIMQLNVASKHSRLTIAQLQKGLLPIRDLRADAVYSNLTSAILEGQTVLIVDGFDKALLMETRQFESRSIVESPTEAVVRGPHTGFVENYRTNIGLVRNLLGSPDLVAERFYVGARSKQLHAILYVEGVVNPKLVDEVRRRVSAIKADWVGVNTIVDRFIEDEPNNPMPTTMVTERPDRVAAALTEGFVVIMNNGPTAIILPATIWSLMQNPEDYYIHYIPGSLLRLVRWSALFLTIYASPLYVALATFHHEMIPTELVMSIAAAREGVPFPAAGEALVLEVGYELIREGGIRIPSIIGPTIGIVGAVILGQAAVQARIVSAILVVIVASSGLGAFAVPNYNLGLAARILKFIMLLAAAVLGLPGIVLVTLVCLGRLFKMRSFGVPYTAPVVPYTSGSIDSMVRQPDFRMRQRPGFLRPLDQTRQPKHSKATTQIKPKGTDPKQGRDDQ